MEWDPLVANVEVIHERIARHKGEHKLLAGLAVDQRVSQKRRSVWALRHNTKRRELHRRWPLFAVLFRFLRCHDSPAPGCGTVVLERLIGTGIRRVQSPILASC